MIKLLLCLTLKIVYFKKILNNKILDDIKISEYINLEYFNIYILNQKLKIEKKVSLTSKVENIFFIYKF